VAPLSLSLLAIILLAQQPEERIQKPGVPPEDVRTRSTGGDLFPTTTAHLSVVTLVMEDGTDPPIGLQILAIGRCEITTIFGSGKIFYRDASKPSNPALDADFLVTLPRECLVSVAGPGLRRVISPLSNGNIILKRLGEHEGSSVSITDLQAPPAAKKAYAKGALAKQREQYQPAAKHFEQAVKLYPGYALAWSELGATYDKQDRADEAKDALVKSIQADPKYLKPIVQLAMLEANRNRWAQSIRASDAALALHPIEFPGAYYYRALAHMRAAQWADAAKHLRDAVQLDTLREFPKSAIMLAIALDRDGNKSAAVQTLETFLAQQQPPAEAERAKAELARLRLN